MGAKNNKKEQMQKYDQALVIPKSKDYVIGVYNDTSEKIKAGLENPYASTGTPIDKIHGAPKFMAVLSNIGGGSVDTGGGGIKEGFNTINDYTKAKTMLQMGEDSKKYLDKDGV